MTAVTELNPADRREGRPFTPEEGANMREEEPFTPEESADRPGEEPFTPEDRLKLRAWVIRRHNAYEGLALEIAGLESGQLANGLQSDVTYEKLRRARQKYEEAQGVLKALVDIC